MDAWIRIPNHSTSQTSLVPFENMWSVGFKPVFLIHCTITAHFSQSRTQPFFFLVQSWKSYITGLGGVSTEAYIITFLAAIDCPMCNYWLNMKIILLGGGGRIGVEVDRDTRVKWKPMGVNQVGHINTTRRLPRFKYLTAPYSYNMLKDVIILLVDLMTSTNFFQGRKNASHDLVFN